ncbi:MAG: SDR family oxidoreductase [Actinobacteria bacterium]|nr:SDR family oxidoreductase [Actinomycetota bacterium]
MSRVLITGCSSGIGRATAIELARRGHEVIATARRPDSILDLDAVEHLALDVTDEQSINDAILVAGPIDTLVNNAGIGLSGPIEMVPLVDVQQMFDVNLYGPIRTMQALVPRMRQHGGGVVVNVSSIAGRVAGPLTGYYSATKRALEAISEALHYEVGHFGIRVVLIEPGLVDDTHFHTRTHHHGDDVGPYDELRRQWEAAEHNLIPGSGPTPATEVAAAIADAVEDPATPFRVPVGDDAKLIAAARTVLDDASFEEDLRVDLGVSW